MDNLEEPSIPATADCVVIGAGPAGLTAALEFIKHGRVPLVLEKSPSVGGIARTESYKQFKFDMGGHRFFSQSDYVNRMWRDLLGEELLLRPRLSQIFYQRAFFAYPPRLGNTLRGLGPWEGGKVAASYLLWQLWPYRREDTFEQWVTNAFGRRLFEIFFKTYTEKVWGIPCTELRAEWAAQRIGELSLGKLLKSFIPKTRNEVTTLINRFYYPRLGPGMLWEAAWRRIHAEGGLMYRNAEVVRVSRSGNHIDGIVVHAGDRERALTADLFISSMPLSELMRKLDPPPPPPVLAAAGNLRHRDFLTVGLILDAADLFPDNWIYVHEPRVWVARIQNYKNWSGAMVADRTKTSLGLEYFCTEGDDLWCMEDAELIALAGRELEAIGLATSAQVLDGCVYRVPDAYPIYDADYAPSLARMRDFCDGLENLRTVGRNGLHRYNNMDHSMLTARYAVLMLLFGERHDLWTIDADQEDRAPGSGKF